MNGDILPILRDWGTRDLKSRTVETLLRDAADEIERLRAERDKYLHTLHAVADFGNRDILRPYVTAAGIEARRG